jgi:hypothetical protein
MAWALICRHRNKSFENVIRLTYFGTVNKGEYKGVDWFNLAHDTDQ